MLSEQPRCPECAYWSRPRRPAEVYSLAAGLWTFNIPKALAIASDGRAPVAFPVAELSNAVAWPPPPPDVISLWGHVNPLHVDHVDHTQPVLIAIGANGIRHPGMKDPFVLIDGCHRIARAIKEGCDSVPSYILEAHETAAIVTTDRRHPWRKRLVQPAERADH